MINSTQNAFEKLKKELADREAQIELKNKEITKLKLGTVEAAANRRQMINELLYMIEQTRTELLRIIQLQLARSNQSLESQVPKTHSNLPIPTEELF